ncbi:MAG: hypothetical protein J7521_19910 [Caulobacter sp.]|nr:hypothetical protein [Caulobacter sp.]
MRHYLCEGVEHFGTLDLDLTRWSGRERWTPDQQDLQAQRDGERRQERQIAESTARLVARLVAERWAEAG